MLIWEKYIDDKGRTKYKLSQGYVAIYPYDESKSDSDFQNKFIKEFLNDFKSDFFNIDDWKENVLTFKTKDDLNEFIAKTGSSDPNYKQICLGIGFDQINDTDKEIH